MHSRNYGSAVRPQNPVRFGKEQPKIPNMFQNQAADDEVEFSITKRQRLVQVMYDKTNRRRVHLFVSFRQHPCREIHGRHLCPRRRKPKSVPSRAATKIQHRSAMHVSSSSLHVGFFQRRKRVGVVIVNRRPAIIAASDGRKAIFT
jgi:hypothetical protein